MKTILVVNGPNLNYLGQRDQRLYGSQTLAQIESWTGQKISEESPEVKLEWFQSNSESDLIDKIQSCVNGNYAGLVINPGGFSHYSISILDALELLKIPVIEVHLSNLFQRENFRQTLLTAKGATAIISGLGGQTYYIAIKAILEKE